MQEKERDKRILILIANILSHILILNLTSYSCLNWFIWWENAMTNTKYFAKRIWIMAGHFQFILLSIMTNPLTAAGECKNYYITQLWRSKLSIQEAYYTTAAILRNSEVLTLYQPQLQSISEIRPGWKANFKRESISLF